MDHAVVWRLRTRMGRDIIGNRLNDYLLGRGQLRVINKLSFRSKLRTAFLGISLLSILITGIFSYSITASIMQDNALKLTQDTVVKSAQNLDEKLSKLMLVTMTFMLNHSFEDMLRDAASRNYKDYYTHMTNMDNLFSQAKMAEPLIHSIYISTPIGEYYPLTMNRNRANPFTETALYEVMKQEKRNVWIEGHEDPLFMGNQRVLSLILQPVTEYPISEVYVVVNIREDGLRKQVGVETEGGSVRFLLNIDAQPVYDERNVLALQAMKSEPVSRIVGKGTSGYETYGMDGETYLLNYAELGINDWTVMAIQSKNHILRDMIHVKWTIMWIAIVCLFVTWLVSGAFTRFLLRPLHSLLHVMKRVERNDLSARFASLNEDELAQVGYRFNRMLEQIVLLIEEVKEAETGKRATEIKALSAQMDPHFLYNTLNTIYWKLKTKKVEDSQQMIVSLSRLFQLGLNKGQEMTTLEKELEHVKQYLALQSFCYENLFEYTIRVEGEWLRELEVPRIILQPLVENSILHGFKRMDSGGQIDISVDSDEALGRWTIRVSDNGRGIDGDVLLLITCRPEQDNGYALGNLLSRLQLCYGDKAVLAVDSAAGQGTTVILTLPREGE